jgi:hypothetical protein
MSFSVSRSFLLYAFVLLLFLNTDELHGQTFEYNPVLVDSLLVENVTDTISTVIHSVSDVSKTGSAVTLDIQSLKPQPSTPSVYIVSTILLFIIIVLKFFFNNFFQSSLLSLPNDKVFMLHFRGNKFSDVIPLLLMYIIKLSVLSIFFQYSALFFLKDLELVSMKYFLIIMVLLAVFYGMRYLIESVTHMMMGSSKLFKPYYVQHQIISTWLWLPSILLVIILFSNAENLSGKLFLTITLIPIAIATLFSLLRSLIIWSVVWRDFLLYFFVYFCTFKILPYLVVAKWVSDNWQILR